MLVHKKRIASPPRQVGNDRSFRSVLLRICLPVIADVNLFWKVFSNGTKGWLTFGIALTK